MNLLNTYDMTTYGTRLEDWERALACLPPATRHKVCARVIAAARARNKREWRAEQEHRKACTYGYHPKVVHG